MTSRLMRGIAAALVASSIIVAASACTTVEGEAKKVASDELDRQKGITTQVVNSALAANIKGKTDNVSVQALLKADYVPTYVYAPDDPQTDRSYVIFRVCNQLTPNECKLKITPTSAKPDIGLPLKEPVANNKAAFDLGFRVSYTAFGAHGGISCNAAAKPGDPLPVLNDPVMNGLVETGKVVSNKFDQAATGAQHTIAIANGDMLCRQA